MTHGKTHSKKIDAIVNAPVEVDEFVELDGLTLVEVTALFDAFAIESGIPVDSVRLSSDFEGDMFLKGSRPPTEREKEHRRNAEHRRLEKARAQKVKQEAAERREFERLRKKYADR